VARHNNELDLFYREIWGRHVHHGYWATGRETPAEAVEALVGLVADRLRLEAGQRVCDIGCGYGATALALGGAPPGAGDRGHDLLRAGGTRQDQHGAEPARRDRRAGLLENDFQDGCFDGAYAIESSEHMVDKARFFREVFRTLRPGGDLVVCAWLAKADAPPWAITHLLEPICREGRLPSMGDESDYRVLGDTGGFHMIRCEDLSANVRRTWTICAAGSRARTPLRYRRCLLDQGSANGCSRSVMRLTRAARDGSNALLPDDGREAALSRPSRGKDGSPLAPGAPGERERRSLDAAYLIASHEVEAGGGLGRGEAMRSIV
jgi:tocopherol O-methyltransferase